jgi:hypothetical protein
MYIKKKKKKQTRTPKKHKQEGIFAWPARWASQTDGGACGVPLRLGRVLHEAACRAAAESQQFLCGARRAGCGAWSWGHKVRCRKVGEDYLRNECNSQWGGSSGVGISLLENRLKLNGRKHRPAIWPWQPPEICPCRRAAKEAVAALRAAVNPRLLCAREQSGGVAELCIAV